MSKFEELTGARDFAPDLKVPKENLSRKTSISLDVDIVQELDRKKVENNINVSAFINKVLTQYLSTSREIDECTGMFGPDAYVKIEILMHREVAIFLELLKLWNGSIQIAGKMAEILSHDTAGFMSGDMNIYGSNETLPRSLAAFNRAADRLRKNP